ncbi:MAG: homoserine O-acetyltransferase [Bacteroidetes bacterium]|nr:MAG: homoserine O-acetyltransferase [Bacteroidota bacterium]
MSRSKNLKFHSQQQFQSFNGTLFPELVLSYEVFGPALEEKKPVVLVCHALTGNSTITGEKGWWNDLIGEDRLISLSKFTVIGINIPGNGYHSDEKATYAQYRNLNVRDIAKLFVNLLREIGVSQLFVAIGGSLGGGICWEIAATFPDFVQTIIPVATDWKATDWVLAHNKVQEQILIHSSDPLHDARMMAMMFYRTPESLKMKFDRSINPSNGLFNIETWLLRHGEKLRNRFNLDAYLLMTHYLSSLDIGKDRGGFQQVVSLIKARVIMIGVDSDLFFQPAENKDTVAVMKQNGCDASYREIVSIHGHDSFLIEFGQLTNLLQDVFHESDQLEKSEYSNYCESIL